MHVFVVLARSTSNKCFISKVRQSKNEYIVCYSESKKFRTNFLRCLKRQQVLGIKECKRRACARSRRWYAANKKRAKARQAVWRQAHPGSGALSGKKWRALHPRRAKALGKAYRHKHRARIRRYMREWANKNRTEKRLAILRVQGGKCAICGTTAPGKQGWMLDHCHRTRYIRGVLCCNCNWGLGHFKDSHRLLRRAITYIHIGASNV